MANEDMKDFNAMLNNNKDMPKMQIVTELAYLENCRGIESEISGRSGMPKREIGG